MAAALLALPKAERLRLANLLLGVDKAKGAAAAAKPRKGNVQS